MAQTSWPFENVDTTEVQFSQWARHINEGIRPDFANELEVFADDSGLNVKVKSGQAMVRGHYYASTAEETLTITTPDATNPRIDSVVLELDIVANSILLKVVAGTPAASPVAPTLTQSEDGNVYQLLLANVDVAAGVFSIEANDVTDLRTYMFQGVGKWTTATRPDNPIDNQTIGYNTTLGYHEYFDGTNWQSLANLDPSPDEIITTQGDLIIGDASGNAVRLPVGTADQVLTSDGTTVSFQDAGGGGGIELISTSSMSGSTFTISSIPQTYKKLIFEVFDTVHDGTSDRRLQWYPNGAAGITSYVGADYDGFNDYLRNKVSSFFSHPNNWTASITDDSAIYFVIDNYTSTTQHKGLNIYGSINLDGDKKIFNFAGVLNTNSAITSFSWVQDTNSLTSGTVKLYGVK